MYFPRVLLNPTRFMLLGTCLLCGLCVEAKGKEKQPAPGLSQFYIVNKRVSDAAPFWFLYILNAKPQGEDILVRYIRIAPRDEFCELVTVKAVEKQLLHRPVRWLADKIDLCSISPEDVDRAISKARVEGASIFDTDNFGIVARCGKADRLFKLPYPELVNLRSLKKDAPQVAALYDLNYHVYRRAFGKENLFYDITPERDLAFQRFGEKLVPELRSGAFDYGIWREMTQDNPHPLQSILEGYVGPLSTGSSAHAVLMNQENYHFVKYVPLTYPPLAKMARIQGKVELEITVEPSSGLVKDIRPISGHPLLQKSATDTVRQWEFRPSELGTPQVIRVSLDFFFKCPDRASE